MLPKNEKELELYFMLEELKVLNKRKHENFGYMDDHFKQIALDKYEALKTTYLKLVNE